MAQITNHTIDFLKELASNNHKEWFDLNRNRYETSKNEVAQFAQDIINNLNLFDDISTPSGKKSLYRIFRDVRFSKDKTPYKSHYSCSFARSGEDKRGGYYLSIHPGGQSFVGGGFYAPSKEDLLLIRQQIQGDPTPLRNVLGDTNFKDYFGELKGEQLKSAPKGFAKDDSAIDLLRFKQFYVLHRFSDEEVLQTDFLQKVVEGYKKIQPFFSVMTNYLTTDLNGEKHMK